MIVSKEKCRDLSDAAIVQKALIEVDYFSCLYERYEDKLLRYVLRLSSLSNQEAEDVLQDAFIKVWRNLNGLDTSLPISSWLYRLVHNETISYLRKQQSYGKNKTVDIDLLKAELTDDSADDESGEDALEFTREMLDAVPLKYREVLVLKYLEKMPYQEISDVLKIPEGTVAIRLKRAKDHFKKIAEKGISNIDF
ncbi:MAG: RNA polymerase sigma factor [Saprospiraceae bacterium]|nr:RNA polymerase sigma factor [Saprospiraceae bacterium]